MKRWILPVILLIAFILEGMVTTFYPSPIYSDQLFVVPRFLAILLLYFSIFGFNVSLVVYAAIFGLLVDITYTGVIGIYLFAYPFFTLVFSKLSDYVRHSVFYSVLLSILFVIVIDFYTYAIYVGIGFVSMTINDYAIRRLIPLVALNSSFSIICIMFIKKIISYMKITTEQG